MTKYAEAFISAAECGLSSYRRKIKNARSLLQIFPIDKGYFTLAYGPLMALLREVIGQCNATIHLDCLAYGHRGVADIQTKKLHFL